MRKLNLIFFICKNLVGTMWRPLQSFASHFYDARFFYLNLFCNWQVGSFWHHIIKKKKAATIRLFGLLSGQVPSCRIQQCSPDFLSLIRVPTFASRADSEYKIIDFPWAWLIFEIGLMVFGERYYWFGSDCYRFYFVKVYNGGLSSFN